MTLDPDRHRAPGHPSEGPEWVQGGRRSYHRDQRVASPSPRGDHHPVSPRAGRARAASDSQTFEWLTAKLSSELASAREREAKTRNELVAVQGMMEGLRGEVTEVWKENAALQAKVLSLEAERQGRDHDAAAQLRSLSGGSTATNSDDRVTSLCQSTMTQLRTWFDDRSKMQSIIAAQQEEITRLTAAVRKLSEMLEGTPTPMS
eukprot:Sspe_Gene.17143::Locus_6074_Transcript_1_2_Confidence_0.667_Length_2278::g.17143::m.17143